jgi:hypothetical protein
MAESSSLAIATNIFTAPSEAFSALRERPRVWLPLLVLIVGYAAVSFTYMNEVDLAWFLENQFAQTPNLTEAEREQAATAAASASPMFYGALGAITTPLFVVLVLFLTALYYTIVSFFSHDGVKLKQWFALACWCTLPAALGLVAQLVNLAINDARFMMQDEINPLAFGTLLSIEMTPATPLVQRILLSMDLTVIWSIALSALGYQLWTKSSFVKSVLVVIGPLAAIIVIGTLATLR